MKEKMEKGNARNITATAVATWCLNIQKNTAKQTGTKCTKISKLEVTLNLKILKMLVMQKGSYKMEICGFGSNSLKSMDKKNIMNEFREDNKYEILRKNLN